MKKDLSFENLEFFIKHWNKLLLVSGIITKEQYQINLSKYKILVLKKGADYGK